MTYQSRPRPVGPVEKKPARRAERPDGPVYHGLTAAELAFRELIAGIEVRPGRIEINPSYSLWCRAARARWEREHVEYQHDDGTWHPDPPENGKQMIAWRHKR